MSSLSVESTATDIPAADHLPYRPFTVTMILFLLVVHIVFSLALKGYWHRDNNYAIRPSEYRIRTIDAAAFAKLTAEQQRYWAQDGSSDAYLAVTIKNPFVFWHVSTTLWPILAFALVAFLVSVWEHRTKLNITRE